MFVYNYNRIFRYFQPEDDSVKNKLDSLFFTQLFVSERKQIALMADANLIFASPLRDKSLRNED